MLVPRVATADTATWLFPASGTWSDPANWSTNPASPNSTAYDALIAAVGSPYTVTVRGPTTIRSLTQTSPDATFRLSGSTFTATSGIILAAGSTIALDTGAFFNQNLLVTPTIAGAGDIVFDSTGAAPYTKLLGSSNSLTLGPAITVRTGLGTGTIGNSTLNTFLNQGTISAQTAEATLAISVGASTTNTGTIQATNNAALTFTSTGSFTNTGTLAASNGGTLDFAPAGSWTNTGLISADNAVVNLRGSVTPPAIGTLSVANGGSINLAARVDATAAPLTLSAANPFQLAGASITGTITSADSTPLIASAGTSVLNSATVNAPAVVQPGAVLDTTSSTFNQPVTVNGGTFKLLGSGATYAPVTATAHATVVLPPTAIAHAPVSLFDSTLNVIDATTAATRVATLVRSTIFDEALLDNTGDNLQLSPDTTTLTLCGGRVNGGTISGPAGTPTVFTTESLFLSVFDGVTLAADAVIGPSAPAYFNNLTLVNAHVAINSDTRVTSFSGKTPQSVSGTGVISFEGNKSATFNASASLTLAAGITVRTGSNSGTLGPGNLVLNGTVSAETAGKTLTVNGTISNTGAFQALNSACLSILSASFTNTGTITVDPASTLLVTGAAAKATLGRVRLSGTGILNYSGASPLDSVRQQLLLGRTSAGSDGIADPASPGNPARSLAYIEASQLLNLAGSNTATFKGQSVDATTLLLVPTLTGDANLDGTLNSDDYALLDHTLAMNTPNPHWTDGDFNYDGIINNQDYLAIDTTYLSTHPAAALALLPDRQARFGPDYVASLLTSLPEPASPLLLLTAASGLLTPRRSRRPLRVHSCPFVDESSP